MYYLKTGAHNLYFQIQHYHKTGLAIKCHLFQPSFIHWVCVDWYQSLWLDTPSRTCWSTRSSRSTTAFTLNWLRKMIWSNPAWSSGFAWTTPRSSTESTRTTTPSSSCLSFTKTCQRRWHRRWWASHVISCPTMVSHCQLLICFMKGS